MARPGPPNRSGRSLPALAVTFTVLAAALAAAPASAHVEVTPAEVRSRLFAGGNVVLLDVREYGEFCDVRGHVENAVCLPWISGVLEARAADLPPLDWDVIVTCASGGRSHTAATWLDDQGFTSVMDMQGGMTGWPYATEACATRPLLAVAHEGGATVLDWIPADGTQDYDVLRGDLVDLADDGARVNLGPALCLRRLTAYTYEADLDRPGPGRAWFYVVRITGSDYGTCTDGHLREAAVPGCD